MDGSEPDTPSPGASSERSEQLRRLIARAAVGDARAFEALYAATAPWLLARVQRTVGVTLAEDVLTEVYLQVWRSLDTFDPLRGDPQSWLATVARSRSLDRLRHERARPGGVHWIAYADAGDLLSHDDGPQQRCEQQQVATQLRLCMARLLSGRERLVLGLAYWRDHSHSEIAVLTGLPIGTVKTLLNRSQQKLRERLNPAAASTRPVSTIPGTPATGPVAAPGGP